MNKRKEELYNQIEQIQENAAFTATPNTVPTELTYQQAFSVLLRSEELAKEASKYSGKLSKEELNRQIDECYRQRNYAG